MTSPTTLLEPRPGAERNIEGSPLVPDMAHVIVTPLVAIPSTAEVVARCATLAPIPRFWHLLHHARTLIRLHGPYTTYENTTVLIRAPTSHPTTELKPPSLRLLITSLAAAQDAYGSAQPDSPAKDDLDLFTALWKTSVQVVEEILEVGIPDGEAFGWGVHGLLSGHIPSFSSTSPSPENNAYFDDDLFPDNEYNPLPAPSRASDTAFDALQQRLRAALSSLPGVGDAQRGRGEKHRVPNISPAERVGRLVNTRNEVHLCGTLLVQILRETSWRRVRWGHLVVVVERWLGNLALEKGEKGEKERG